MMSFLPISLDESSPTGESSEGYVDLLLAMLVVEDGLVGILMAILPLIAGHSSEKSHSLAHAPVGSIHNMFHGAFGGRLITLDMVYFHNQPIDLFNKALSLKNLKFF